MDGAHPYLRCILYARSGLRVSESLRWETKTADPAARAVALRSASDTDTGSPGCRPSEPQSAGGARSLFRWHPNNPGLRPGEFPAPAPLQIATNVRTRCACQIGRAH